jgi:hypothetical protein
MKRHEREQRRDEAARTAGAIAPPHWVPMHLRQYTERSGRRPSLEKQRTYAEARRHFGVHGILPEELPPGATWVEPYSWGVDGADEDCPGHFSTILRLTRRTPIKNTSLVARAGLRRTLGRMKLSSIHHSAAVEVQRRARPFR